MTPLSRSRAGKHVYAEKPCALNESDLDRIVATAHETGLLFREMAGTAFGRPYYAMREIVASGFLGEIVRSFPKILSLRWIGVRRMKIATAASL